MKRLEQQSNPLTKKGCGGPNDFTPDFYTNTERISTKPFQNLPKLERGEHTLDQSYCIKLYRKISKADN